MTNQKEAKPTELSLEEAVAADFSVRFSLERTILSHERTLMAWVRTATSLITFGFSIYKFFQLELGGKIQAGAHPGIGVRQFSMILIAMGLGALILAAIQNWRFRESLRKHHMKVPASLATFVASLIGFLGILAMIATILRW